MFNDFFFIQLLLILLILSLYFINDNLNFIIFGIIYLLLLVLYSYLNDSDIYTSFLIIIDLGIFFIMFTFITTFSNFLYSKYNYINDFKIPFLITIIVLFLILLLFLNKNNLIFNFNKIINFIWFFYITYYDYFNLNNLNITSDMIILKEIYFNYNYFEFFLLSLLVYISIFVSYILFTLINKIVYKNNNYLINKNKLKNKLKNIFFFKNQSFNKQSNSNSSSKLWNKKK